MNIIGFRKSYCCVIAFLTLGVTANSAPIVGTSHTFDPIYPTVKGAKWVYKSNGIETVYVLKEVSLVKQTYTLTIVEIKEGKEHPFEMLSISKDGVFRIALLGKKEESPYCLIKFPVRPNLKWDIEMTGGFTHTFNTIDIADVKIMGKISKAIKIESTASHPAFDKPLASVIHWYSSGIGIVKMIKGDSEQELVDFFLPPSPK